MHLRSNLLQTYFISFSYRNTLYLSYEKLKKYLQKLVPRKTSLCSLTLRFAYVTFLSKARVFTKLPFDTSSNYLLSTLDWERLFLRRKKRKALTMFKTMNGLAPDYLQRLFSQRHSVYNLRDSEGKLTLPKPNTNYLKRSFSYSGVMLWNNLPKCLTNAVSVNNFKQIIKNVADISDSQSCKTVL